MKLIFTDGTSKEGEICNECKEWILGKTCLDLSGKIVVISDRKLTGVCVGSDWIERYECMKCYKTREIRSGYKEPE